MIELEQPTLFDYASLDGDTRAFVQEKTQEIKAHLKRVDDEATAIGFNLIAVKKITSHGQFADWMHSEFGMTPRTAQRLMSLAENYDPNATPASHLGWSVRYELLSAPEPVIKMVESGDIPPTRAAIREAKQEYQQAQEAPIFSPTWNHVDGVPFTAPLPDGKPVEVPDEWKLRDTQREIRREQVREHLDQLREKGVELPAGKYSCLVVDPPWQMQKIERDVRPNQVEFEYPTMSEEELQAFPLPDMAADDCHLYLWTTQKHLPLALRLAEHWGFRYQCLLTWVKNVGFTPYSWMYSTEHVLFCRKGNLPLLKLGEKLHFHANVREHSRKPDEFYDLVRLVSPGPHLDVFSREKRDGFDQYGNEVEKYVSA